MLSIVTTLLIATIMVISTFLIGYFFPVRRGKIVIPIRIRFIQLAMGLSLVISISWILLPVAVFLEQDISGEPQGAGILFFVALAITAVFQLFVLNKIAAWAVIIRKDSDEIIENEFNVEKKVFAVTNRW